MISRSLEEYLKTMYVLNKQNGNIRVTDIANKMDCSKPSVNKPLNNLKEEKLIKYETYGTIELTKQGESLAQKILEAYDIVYLFLNLEMRLIIIYVIWRKNMQIYKQDTKRHLYIC